jgi:hypothetical protein
MGGPELHGLGRLSLPQLMPGQAARAQGQHREPAQGHQAAPQQRLRTLLFVRSAPLRLAARLREGQLARREISVATLAEALQQIQIRRAPEAALRALGIIPETGGLLQAALEAQIVTVCGEPVLQPGPGLNQRFVAEFQGFLLPLIPRCTGAGDEPHIRVGKTLDHSPHGCRIFAVGDDLCQQHAATGVAAAFPQLHQAEKQALGDALLVGAQALVELVGFSR